MPNPTTDAIIKNDTHIIEAAGRLKVLSHPIRLKIICQLGYGEKTVQELIDQVGTSQSNVSQHLAIMRDKGVLSCRKNSTQVIYKVVNKHTIELVKLLKTMYP
ncbi:MAG: transcriptional regulator [Piscirickettsiaceae bacterium]|nr:MAG: transcriptional regulator [Piscirickettsiaceae bacterium]PCI66642.1 MAG: transcriptional regulator [Piscirickettsiaceae bacterium]